MDNSDNLVIDIFKEISKIPRESGHEKKISNFLKDRYKNLGLEVRQDEFYNIYIKKPATKGYEDKKGVILQGHMDMVCIKEPDSNHDFSKDPIDLYVEGDYLHARKTTLGADNGIGVAMALSILEDENAEHPPLEVLITTSEETGMDGAIGFNKKQLSGDYLINIDSEDEGYITASCAGGLELTFDMDVEREPIGDFDIGKYTIKVHGLKGGHSGTEISNIHLNSIKLSFEILEKIRTRVPFSLINFTGGTKHNAIPKESEVNLVVLKENEDLLLEVFDQVKSELLENNLKRESDIEIDLEKNNKEYKVSITEDSFKKLNSLVQLLPHGVNTMLDDLDIPESSDNLAIMNVDSNGASGVISIRSSNEEKLIELRDNITGIIEYMNGRVEYNQGYPAWEFKENSILREVIKDSYRKITGKEMVVEAIHAGLECGLFAKALPNLDMVSIGPDLYDIHTTNERASLSSIKRMYEILVETLKNL